MQVAGKLYSGLMLIAKLVSAAILLVLTGAVFTSVIVRYFGLFQGSMPWIDEMARYLSIWLVFLGSATALEQRKHVSADFMVGLVPLRGRPYLNLLIQLSILFFLVALTREGISLSQRTMLQSSPALGIPMGYIYMAIPVGGALMILGIVKSVFEAVGHLRSPEAGVVPDPLEQIGAN